MPDSCTHCNILVIKHTEDHINNLSYVDLQCFLKTFSKDCLNSIEYSEYSNDILYKVLEKYPENFIRCMTIEKTIDSNYILSELSTPLLDINCAVIFKKVQNASGSVLIKDKILKALNKAEEYLKN